MRKALCLGGVALSMACVEPVEVTGELADLEVLTVEARGPVQCNDGTSDVLNPKLQVAVSYRMRDFEGDDQTVKIEVCSMTRTEEPIAGSDQMRVVFSEAECGFPIQGANSDGTVAVPTAPRRTPTTHVFLWEPAKGRISSASDTAPADALLETTLFTTETEPSYYRFKLRVPGRPFDTSPTFALIDPEDPVGLCE